jgi:acid stress-induced BolA-like protein IbaG/YrbA
VASSACAHAHARGDAKNFVVILCSNFFVRDAALQMFVASVQQKIIASEKNNHLWMASFNHS